MTDNVALQNAGWFGKSAAGPLPISVSVVNNAGTDRPGFPPGFGGTDGPGDADGDQCQSLVSIARGWTPQPRSLFSIILPEHADLRNSRSAQTELIGEPWVRCQSALGSTVSSATALGAMSTIAATQSPLSAESSRAFARHLFETAQIAGSGANVRPRVFGAR